jgi:hypothetical protein
MRDHAGRGPGGVRANHVGRCESCRLIARDVRMDPVTRLKLCPRCWVAVDPGDYRRRQHPMEALTRRGEG